MAAEVARNPRKLYYTRVLNSMFSDASSPIGSNFPYLCTFGNDGLSDQFYDRFRKLAVAQGKTPQEARNLTKQLKVDIEKEIETLAKKLNTTSEKIRNFMLTGNLADLGLSPTDATTAATEIIGAVRDHVGLACLELIDADDNPESKAIELLTISDDAYLTEHRAAVANMGLEGFDELFAAIPEYFSKMSDIAHDNPQYAIEVFDDFVKFLVDNRTAIQQRDGLSRLELTLFFSLYLASDKDPKTNGEKFKEFEYIASLIKDRVARDKDKANREKARLEEIRTGNLAAINDPQTLSGVKDTLKSGLAGLDAKIAALQAKIDTDFNLDSLYVAPKYLGCSTGFTVKTMGTNGTVYHCKFNRSIPSTAFLMGIYNVYEKLGLRIGLQTDVYPVGKVRFHDERTTMLDPSVTSPAGNLEITSDLEGGKDLTAAMEDGDMADFIAKNSILPMHQFAEIAAMSMVNPAYAVDLRPDNLAFAHRSGIVVLDPYYYGTNYGANLEAREEARQEYNARADRFIAALSGEGNIFDILFEAYLQISYSSQIDTWSEKAAETLEKVRVEAQPFRDLLEKCQASIVEKYGNGREADRVILKTIFIPAIKNTIKTFMGKSGINIFSVEGQKAAIRCVKLLHALIKKTKELTPDDMKSLDELEEQLNSFPLLYLTPESASEVQEILTEVKNDYLARQIARRFAESINLEELGASTEEVGTMLNVYRAGKGIRSENSELKKKFFTDEPRMIPEEERVPNKSEALAFDVEVRMGGFRTVTDKTRNAEKQDDKKTIVLTNCSHRQLKGCTVLIMVPKDVSLAQLFMEIRRVGFEKALALVPGSGITIVGKEFRKNDFRQISEYQKNSLRQELFAYSAKVSDEGRRAAELAKARKKPHNQLALPPLAFDESSQVVPTPMDAAATTTAVKNKPTRIRRFFAGGGSAQPAATRSSKAPAVAATPMSPSQSGDQVFTAPSAPTPQPNRESNASVVMIEGEEWHLVDMEPSRQPSHSPESYGIPARMATGGLTHADGLIERKGKRKEISQSVI